MKKNTITKKKTTIYLKNKDLYEETTKSLEKGQMTDKLAAMFLMLVQRYARRSNFVNYCVDEETDTLTKRGWLKYNELSTDDEILSYDPSDGNLKWSNILDIYINPTYNGMMHHLTTQGMDALVTPNHKFVSKERGIIPVEDIICNEHIILTGAPVSAPNEKIYQDSFVKLVGWTITEGHYIKNSVRKRNISISQKLGNNSNKIKECLTETNNVHFNEYIQGDDLVIFKCRGESIDDIYDNIAPNRVLSIKFILSLTQEQRLLLIETMVNGDGWFRPNKGMSYTQKDINHMDMFILLCTISGLTTSTKTRFCNTPISKTKPNGGITEIYVTNIYSKPKIYCKAEKIDFHGGRATPGGRRYQKQNTPTTEYQGVIWCPQTEYGTFMCRRNGYVYITGNTYNDDMQGYALQMLVQTWKAFKPDRSHNAFAFYTQCVKNSFRYYLNTERKQRDIRDKMLVTQGFQPSYTYTEAYNDQQNDRLFAEDEENMQSEVYNDNQQTTPEEYTPQNEEQ